MSNKPNTMSGGCQCGAVRYAVRGDPQEVAICHCRMCQKAVGSVFWPYVTVLERDVGWTRGQPTLYRSSADAMRGFCAACGTPLIFQRDGSDQIDVSLGSFDDPALLVPTQQEHVASRMPWFDALPNLPEGSAPPLTSQKTVRRQSYQHPDHNTESWEIAGHSR